ncbi:MAG: hypothetical protein HOP28_14825 [Gemmatimonadales bacterium]|nr:hypothetical protein [Gemmatimonadales bacterium]
MFVGHLAVALIAKRASPKTSLGWYVAAATALDLLWPLFLLAGIEQVRIVPGAMAFNFLVFDSYPWSHSLLMVMAWALLLAAMARRFGVDTRSASLIGVLVVSHWVLDVVTHAPDLPLWPGHSPRFGLGLWNSALGTLLIEGALWVAALALYLAPRRATAWMGRLALWSLVLVCSAMWAMGPWSPPPPSAESLAWFALIGWIVVPWAAWADRGWTEHRT